MSIVVTGATGHLGRLIVEALLRDGTPASEIIAGGRSLDKISDLAERGVRIAQVDYTDAATLDAAFAGASTLVLVSSSEVGQRVAQHAAAITAAASAGIGHIVYTSAPAADTSALILAPEHKATEELIRNSGIPFTILRNGWYTENYAGTMAQAKESGVVVASVGDGKVASASRVDYADAAAAVAVGSGFAGTTFELSGDVAWDYHELAAAIGSVLGREVTYTPISAEEHHAQLVAAGLDEGTAGFVVALDGDTRAGLLGVVTGELSTLIGRPTTSLRDGLASVA
ncbi:MAG: NAD(P)-dependent oxidoreductase [Glaciihabitans sp.]|nr:NAD(P)-dependent oxidoreductase [Glaciihabitans sp.]